MDQVLGFVQRYGQAVVFGIVFLDQLGLPIPTVPLLLALGALAGQGVVDPTASLLVAALASLCADSVWFHLGRWKGSRVLGWLCRISLEPDSCVSKTRDLFAKRGAKSLLFAKFVPGYDTVAPPLAGLLGMRFLTFLLWSAGGALLWIGVCGGLGYVFSDSLEAIAGALNRVGGTLGLLIVAFISAYVAWKYVARQRVLRSIRMARITPQELHELILSGQNPVVVDARSRSAVDALPIVIAGAIPLTLEEVDGRHLEVPRNREIVVYCSCPNEISAARVAMRLKRLGFERVRPLTGGIEAWQSLRLPVVSRSDG